MVSLWGLIADSSEAVEAPSLSREPRFDSPATALAPPLEINEVLQHHRPTIGTRAAPYNSPCSGSVAHRHSGIRHGRCVEDGVQVSALPFGPHPGAQAQLGLFHVGLSDPGGRGAGAPV